MASPSGGPPGRGAIHRRHSSDFDDASHLFEKFRLPQYPVFKVPPPPRRGFGRSALPCGARDDFTRFRPCCQELFLKSFEVFLARSLASNLPKLLPQARASLSHTGRRKQLGYITRLLRLRGREIGASQTAHIGTIKSRLNHKL